MSSTHVYVCERVIVSSIRAYICEKVIVSSTHACMCERVIVSRCVKIYVLVHHASVCRET